jgi:hypothetical protein
MDSESTPTARPADTAPPLIVIVRYLASAIGIGCDGATDALSGGMAHHQQRRSNHRASAEKSSDEASASACYAREAGHGELCEMYVVTDDFPAKIAMSSRELDVIEAFLGVLLDDLLK